jgi:O-antigen/teichoic acid export membrane protein
MGLQQRFLSDSLFFQIVNWLVKPLWIFIIDREIQNLLGEEMYGSYFIHLNYALLFLMMTDLGIHQFQTRSIAENKRFIMTGAGGLMVFKMTLSVGYMAWVWGSGLLNGLIGWWLIAIAVNQLLASWILYYRTFLAGFEKFKPEAMISISDKFISGLICALFLFTEWREHLTLSLFIGIQSIGLLITLAAAVGTCLSYNIRPRLHIPSVRRSKQLLLANLPFALLAFIMNFYQRLDVFFLHHWSENGNMMAGIYAQSIRFVEAYSMYIMLFTGMLFPIMARLIREKTPTDALLMLVLKLAWIPGSVLAAIGQWKSGEMISLLYHTTGYDLLESSKVFTLCMWIYFPISGSLITGALLTAGHKLKQLIMVTLSALLLLIGTCWIYIPTLGAYGASISVLITQGFVWVGFSILILVFFPDYRKTTHLLSMIKLLVLITLTVILGGMISHLNMWIFSAYLTIFTTILALILGLVQVSDVKKFFKPL